MSQSTYLLTNDKKQRFTVHRSRGMRSLSVKIIQSYKETVYDPGYIYSHLFSIFCCLNDSIVRMERGDSNDKRLFYTSRTFSLLTCLTSCLNPVIYVSGTEQFKVPISSMWILSICNLWILLRKIVIYIVGRKCLLHGRFCC